MADDLGYYLGFSHFLGIGPFRFQKLIGYYASVEKAYWANANELKELLGVRIAEKFVRFREEFNIKKKLQEIHDKNIKVIAFNSSDYPFGLKKISDPPICLYVKGSFCWQGQKYLVAIVGTRKPSRDGQKIAGDLGFQLAKNGVLIVSGMALGIDAQAHWGALRANQKTIAILGCGVDIVYPALNRGLYQKIIKTGGAIISEFPPGQLVQKGLFIARNRLIAGLCQAVVVVEGSKDSGALITARYAAEQGREVFAVPSSIVQPQSIAPNLLIKQGAKILTSVDDIFDELGIKKTKKITIKEKLANEEKKILGLLNEVDMNPDQISRILKLPISQILKTLSLMEIKGLIEKNDRGYYQLK